MNKIPSQTLRNQRDASSPDASAWVSANAGSGKTFVLAQRVVRLLLAGTDPSRILCLTFTKSAAAEMAMRVFRILGEWTSFDDQKLAEEIEKIEGNKPDDKLLQNARRLFARALETPGGLKVQTIHAFCEAILHQFPLEAGIPSHFEVLDERRENDLLSESRAKVLQFALGHPDQEIGTILTSLIDLMSDFAVESAINEIITKRDKFRQWLTKYQTLDDAIREFKSGLGIQSEETLDSINQEVINSPIFPEPEWDRLATVFSNGGTQDNVRADAITEAIQTSSLEKKCILWKSVFFTKSEEPKKRLYTNALSEEYPEICERLDKEQSRLISVVERRRNLFTALGTEGLLRLADLVLTEYENIKIQRGLLDFEDLIICTAGLLSTSEASLWVQYKLDNGLDHILVDEAQDTSPRQWEVINSMSDEFFSGLGARETDRTVFAVGDEKQSIYSFQGAEPTFFAKMRRAFRAKTEEAGHKFNDIRLNLSFRSTNEVLNAVDTVFANARAFKGLSQDSERLVHESIRGTELGLVEVWPPELAQEPLVEDDWTKPIDREGPDSPMFRLADRLADKVHNLIENDQISAGDILILVRKRGPIIEVLNRALKRKGIATAGSDRLVLTDHLAVKDLISLGEFLLLEEDDLSLAEVLKSPLFGFTDEQLFDLAHERKTSLYKELQQKANQDQLYMDALNCLQNWQSELGSMLPFEFYSKILGSDGGRLLFKNRMGVEADDVLDEFLMMAFEYEQVNVPQLQGFLSWLVAAPTQIKREFSATSDALRIMTVHGAKGLEASVVFMIDSGGNPVHPSHNPAILELYEDENTQQIQGMSWLPPKLERPDWLNQRIEIEQEYSREEYRRLLYVAMTRAKDQLFICGWAPKKGPHEDCWFSLVKEALEPDSEKEFDEEGELISFRWILNDTQRKLVKSNSKEDSSGKKLTPLPAWIKKQVKSPKQSVAITPTSIAKLSKEGTQFYNNLTKSGVENLISQDNDNALLIGNCVHRLIEILPSIEKSKRVEIATNVLKQMLKDEFDNLSTQIISDVIKILDDEKFTELFAPNGKSEIEVTGLIEGANKKNIEITGRIDRLIINENEILIVDFKTTRQPPQTIAQVQKEYIIQLGIYYLLLEKLYPSHTIKCALLWTHNATLMEIDKKIHTSATKAYFLGESIS